MKFALRFLFLTSCFSFVSLRADAAEGSKPPARVPVGECVSETASFLRRESPEKDWQIVRKEEKVLSGDLLLAGADASLSLGNGSILLNTLGELTGVSEFPVIETALVLHEAKEVDLDFTMDRGRIELTNLKKTGAAKVRIRIRDRIAEVTLTTPGTRAVLELYGRWPRGVPFKKDAKPEYGPPLAAVALVLKGEAELSGKSGHTTLKAPPGPALLYLENLGQSVPTPQNLDKLPAWAQGGGKPEVEEARRALLKKFRKTASEKSIQAAIDELLQSDNELSRRGAMYMLGATDNLESLTKTMRETKQLDVWESGVLALRHWIGRAPGQDQKLYQGLIEKGKFSPVQAETVMQLLHSRGDEDRARPETYETLIDYLEHDQLAIRGLAYWHLERLVPDGKKLGYNPLAAKDARSKAVTAWRELIPSGKLPPAPKPSGSGSKQ